MRNDNLDKENAPVSYALNAKERERLVAVHVERALERKLADDHNLALVLAFAHALKKAKGQG